MPPGELSGNDLAPRHPGRIEAVRVWVRDRTGATRIDTDHGDRRAHHLPHFRRRVLLTLASAQYRRLVDMHGLHSGDVVFLEYAHLPVTFINGVVHCPLDQHRGPSPRVDPRM